MIIVVKRQGNSKKKKTLSATINNQLYVHHLINMFKNSLKYFSIFNMTVR